MKIAAVPAVCVWFLCASSALGQFTILSDERSVEGHAQWSTYILRVGPIEATYDERVIAALMEPLSMTLTAVPVVDVAAEPEIWDGGPLYGPASATVWHDSRVSASEIFLSGGTGDVYGSHGAWSSVGTTARVEFALAAAAMVELEYERIDEGNTGGIVPYTHSGDASIFITGPGVNVSIPAVTLADWAACDSACRATRLPAPPVIGREMLTLAAGTYVIDATAGARSSGPASQELPQPLPASFMVRVTATPIPEPHMLAVAALAGLYLLSRHILRKRGK